MPKANLIARGLAKGLLFLATVLLIARLGGWLTSPDGGEKTPPPPPPKVTLGPKLEVATSAADPGQPIIIEPESVTSTQPAKTSAGETILFVTAVNEDNQAVENARLVLSDTEGNFIAEGNTDRYGHFRFGNLTETAYVLEGGLPGEQEFNMLVRLVPGKTNELTFELLYQTGGTITGYIRFANGEAIPGAQVAARKSQNCPDFGTNGDVSTDSTGRYELTVNQPGIYCLAVTEIDWGSVNTSHAIDFIKAVRINPNSNVTADFSLPRN